MYNTFCINIKVWCCQINHIYGNGWWCDMPYRECNSRYPYVMYICTYVHVYMHRLKLNCFLWLVVTGQLVGPSKVPKVSISFSVLHHHFSQFDLIWISFLFLHTYSMYICTPYIPLYEHVFFFFFFWEVRDSRGDWGRQASWRPMRRSSGYPRCDPSPSHRLVSQSHVWMYVVTIRSSYCTENTRACGVCVSRPLMKLIGYQLIPPNVNRSFCHHTKLFRLCESTNLVNQNV